MEASLANACCRSIRRPAIVGLAAAAACAGLAACQLLPEWSVGEAARLARNWFQARTWLYWGLGYAALTALVVQVVSPLVWFRGTTDTAFWSSRTVFVLLTVAPILLLRWPGLAPWERNPDESEEIALALTLQEDPRYWVSAEGGTHGPLVAFALLPARLLRMQLEYGSARLIGLGLLLGCLFFQFGTLRSFFPEAISRAVLTPLTICLAFLRDGFDVIAYNAEHPTIFLLCAGGYGCARLVAGPATGVSWRALATGVALGLVPFTKLQGVPVALVLAGVAGLCLLIRFRGQRRKQWGAVLALVTGGLAPAVLVALYLWDQGLFDHFWMSYLRANLDYASRTGMGVADKFGTYLDWVFGPKWTQGPEVPYKELFLHYFLFTIGAGLLLLVLMYLCRLTSMRMNRGRSCWPLFGGVGVVLLASVYSVIAPGNTFAHYLLFLVFPLAFLASAILATLYEHELGPIGRVALVVAWLMAAVAVPSARALRQGNEWLWTQPGQSDAVVELIRRYARPGDRLVVWGWMDRYYVLSGMRPGTMHSDSAYILDATDASRRNYFYQQFLRQFDAAKPSVFVDAVAEGSFAYQDRNKFGHDIEEFSDLRKLVADRYALVADKNTGRVYVAKERLADLPATQELAVPLTPSAVHWVEWKAGTGKGSGEDCYLVFALPKPQWVAAVRIVCAYQSNGSPALLRMFWKGTDHNHFVNQRQVTFEPKTRGGDETLTFLVKDTVAQIRIHPDNKPRVFTIQEIVAEAPFRLLGEEEEYQLMIERVRKTSQKVLPKGTTVLVASEKEDKLLQLEGRTGLRFPESYTPGVKEAIAQVEAMRARGAEFFLFPKPAFWWLKHDEYRAFREHLDRRYGPPIHRDDCCIIYRLSSPRGGTRG
jgi:hypothetical protein